MDLATASESADEWELCSGDGFIHKRKRRRIDPSSAAPSPADSGVAEEKFRRDRRKKTLLGVKGRYQRELALWEKLSVRCRAMQDNVEQLPREREKEKRRTGRGRLVDDLRRRFWGRRMASRLLSVGYS